MGNFENNIIFQLRALPIRASPVTNFGYSKKNQLHQTTISDFIQERDINQLSGFDETVFPINKA